MHSLAGGACYNPQYVVSEPSEASVPPAERGESTRPSRGLPSPRRNPWAFLGMLVGSGVWLDQATKSVARTRLRGRPFVEIWQGFVELRYSVNRGAFFSMGADLPHGYRRALLLLASSVASVFILHLYRQTRDGQRRLRWALGCLLTGAIGNLIDRARHGEVIDFLHLHIRDIFHWATFNIADIYIAVGLGLLILDLLRPQTAPTPGEPPSPHEQNT